MPFFSAKPRTPGAQGVGEDIAVDAAAVEQHAGVGILVEQPARELEPAASAQPDVDEHDVGAAAADQLVGVVDVVGHADHAQALAAQQQLDALAKGDVVLDEHDRGRMSAGRPGPARGDRPSSLRRAVIVEKRRERTLGRGGLGGLPPRPSAWPVR